MDSGRSGREPVIRAGVSHISIHIPGNANRYQAAGMIYSQEPRQVSNNPAPKAKRKKAKPTPTPDPNRPIPQPYLALAPRPLSSQARQEISNPNLVLPSSYRRPTTSQSQRTDAGPSSRRREEGERFVSGLLAPPTVRAGAGSSTSRPSEGRRRTDRLRQTGQGHAAGNASMTSLGHLGRIMESDTPGQGDDRNPTPAPRRRRRIVREVEDEGAGLTRRLTVSSREEGRAIGLARGASMRRLNVWDGTYLSYLPRPIREMKTDIQMYHPRTMNPHLHSHSPHPPLPASHQLLHLKNNPQSQTLLHRDTN